MKAVNEVVKFTAPPVAALKNIGGAIRQARVSGTPVSMGSGKPFLKLSQEGDGWLFGKEGNEVEDGSLWAANPSSIRHGWVCFQDKPFKKLAEQMWSIFDTGGVLPKQPEEPDGRWAEQWEVTLICLTGEDEGEEMIYSTSNDGGLKALRERLVGDIGERSEAGESAIVPVMKLEFDSYPNKNYGGKTYIPVFNVVEWRDPDDTSPVAGADMDDGEDKPEVQDESEEEPAPARRRRRRA